MHSQYSILVNSSDGYEDCWPPFFTLFQKYWPQNEAPLYLNTERKTWDMPGLKILCTRVEEAAHKRLTWSECLVAALDQIQTPLVLYFQEDYFIQNPVRREIIGNAIRHMIENPNVKHIALTKHCSYGPYEPYSESGLQRIHQKAKYRISTQAGLWRVNALKSYLQPKENGWMFEIFGTWRAHKRNELFLSAKFDDADGGPPIDYTHTGIIKGRWHRDMPQLFARHGIEVDFEKRGFYKEPHWLIRKVGTFKKLTSNPVAFVRGMAGY